MRYLFFFVHPAKFHLFKVTINTLLNKGHVVDILITSKDVLEDLVKAEGWNYENIFPEGRKMKGIPPLISSAINTFRTLFRLYKFTRSKKYDLYVTDDLLVFIGKLRKTPSIVFIDDDISVVKPFGLILSQATRILSPDITDLGIFSKKKIGFPGYKELAYLHPDIFHPNIEIIKQFNPLLKPYFLIRLVSLRSYHDVGKGGISDDNITELIDLLEKYGNVYLSSERNLPVHFEKYRLQIEPRNILHVLNFAQLFIGDSQTMTSEAAVLGTPAFRCNDFVGKISVMEEKEIKYGLSFNYPPSKFNDLLSKIEELLKAGDCKEQFLAKRAAMLVDKINVTAFMIWLLENYNGLDFSKPISFDQFRYKF